MSLPETLTINGVKYQAVKGKTYKASVTKNKKPVEARLPKGWVIPDHWVVNRKRNEYGVWDSAYRLDGYSVGRNGSWFYCSPDPQHSQVHAFSCVERAIYAAEKAFPFDPATVTWPRLVWISPLGESVRSAYALVYGYEKKDEGLYEFDCIRTVREQTWGPHISEWPSSNVWGPEAQWRTEREKVMGTLDHLFVGEAQLQENDRPRYQFRSVPKGTKALLGL